MRSISMPSGPFAVRFGTGLGLRTTGKRGAGVLTLPLAIRAIYHAVWDAEPVCQAATKCWASRDALVAA